MYESYLEEKDPNLQSLETNLGLKITALCLSKKHLKLVKSN